MEYVLLGLGGTAIWSKEDLKTVLPGSVERSRESCKMIQLKSAAAAAAAAAAAILPLLHIPTPPLPATNDNIHTCDDNCRLFSTLNKTIKMAM